MSNAKPRAAVKKMKRSGPVVFDIFRIWSGVHRIEFYWCNGEIVIDANISGFAHQFKIASHSGKDLAAFVESPEK